MKTFKIKFLPSAKEILVTQDSTIYDAALALGMPIQADCGGQEAMFPGQCLAGTGLHHLDHVGRTAVGDVRT